MSKKMLINTVRDQECRIAILGKDKLEELYIERASSVSHVGSIYKARVTNIEPSIQAAFVDYGASKNGFLHVSDLHPQFFPKNKREKETVGRRVAHRSRPPIQECLKRGQELIVQMTKEGIGTKGPTMTSYLSIPGRLLVMMPDMAQVGISRKIEDEEARAKLRKILTQMEIPENMGVIVRTAGVDRTKRELQRDLAYLTRLWKNVQERVKDLRAPAVIYEESDLVNRTLRDMFTSEIDEIIADSPEDGVKVREFIDLATPRTKCKVELFRGDRGLFEEFGVEDEIQRIHSRQVELDRGGTLVFDQAEALVAIDVNSASFREEKDAERNALKLNLMAAEEIGRQLRLRDMGGVVIIDFVDLREEKHRRELEKKMRDVLKNDRAKSKVLRISNFGLMELTRQRLRQSLKQSVYSRCSHCDGSGQIMSPESVALRVIRKLQVACGNDDVVSIEVKLAPSVAQHLQNAYRRLICDMEEQNEKTIVIQADHELSANDVQVHCFNARGATVRLETGRGKKTQKLHYKLIPVEKVMMGELPLDEEDENEEAEASEATAVEEEPKPKKKRRRRSRKKKKPTTPAAEETPQESSGDDQSADSGPSTLGTNEATTGEEDISPEKESSKEESPAKKSKRRRRGSRGGRKKKKPAQASEEQETAKAEMPGSSEEKSVSSEPVKETVSGE